METATSSDVFNIIQKRPNTVVHLKIDAAVESRRSYMGVRSREVENLPFYCLSGLLRTRRPLKIVQRSTCNLTRFKQPIMRIEDRLFDRGWVRSAMATRKCGNIYFRKYFMAVRKFTNIFVLLLILMVGSRHTLFLVCFT